MRHTDAEINRFATAKARELSDGCSKTYHEIKQSLIDQLNKANENADDDEPPGEQMIPPPYPGPPIPEVIFVRKFFAWSFSIMFLLMIALVVWSTITGV